MSAFKTRVLVDGRYYDTLADVLPESGDLIVLFVGKTPATVSVNVGHYFQGKQGRMFWNKLSEYNILNVPKGEYEDEYLLSNCFGLTDIVKVPRDYGHEPSDREYRNGVQHVLTIIKNYKPRVIVFVYKKVLDNIMRLNFNITTKPNYGFNKQLEKYFKTKVFVFPMPGTPCPTEEGKIAMNELKILIQR